MELVGKLTPRTLGWDRNRIGTEVAKVPMDGGKVLLGRIVGIVSGLKQTIDKETGDISSGLKGNFKGISSLDEKPPVNSGVCYLPGGIQEMLEGSLAQAKENDSKATVRFAIDLFAIPATNKAGYSFKADNIVEASETNPLDDLLNEATRIKALADQSGGATTEGAATGDGEQEKAPPKGKEKADA